MAELTSESYHESESDGNYGEVINTDSYYPSYNSTSDFSVSNRLLNTQQVHPKPYPPTHQYSNNVTYPSAYYGWLSTMPSEQGAIRNQSNHYNPPPNQTVYQIPNSNYPQQGGLRYEQHQFVSPVPPPQPSCTSLPVQASPSPSHPCDSTLQGSPSNTSSWNNTGYPFPPAATADSMSMSPQVPSKTELQAQSNNIGNDSYSMLIKDQSTGIDNTTGSGDLLNTDDMVGKNLPVMYEHDRKTDEDDDDSDARSNNGSETEPKKPKRTRTAFTTHQLDQLELCFASSAYPDAFTRDDISRRLNIKEDRIQVWFQNRRARHRKQERTGSVSIRSRARQQRVQRLKESHIMSSMYRYPQGNTVNRMMSPQTPSNSMSQFSFQVMTATSGPSAFPITTVSSPVQPSLYPFSVSETFLSHPPAQAPSSNVVLVNGHHSTLSGATNNES